LVLTRRDIVAVVNAVNVKAGWLIVKPELVDGPTRDKLVDKPIRMHGHRGFAKVEEGSCQ